MIKMQRIARKWSEQMAAIIDGKKISAEIKEEVKQEAALLAEQGMTRVMRSVV